MPHLPAFQSFFSLPECARANRKLLTESEFVLWKALRGSQLGVKSRRQHVLSPFIVDFYAASAKLVVEIDGAVHEGRAARDAARVEQLVALHGVRVVRVGAADIMLNVVAVAATVREVRSPWARGAQGTRLHAFWNLLVFKELGLGAARLASCGRRASVKKTANQYTA